MSIQNKAEEERKARQSDNKHETESTNGQPDTTDYQDCDQADVDTAAPGGTGDISHALLGVGALFPIEAPEMDLMFRIEAILDSCEAAVRL